MLLVPAGGGSLPRSMAQAVQITVNAVATIRIVADRHPQQGRFLDLDGLIDSMKWLIQSSTTPLLAVMCFSTEKLSRQDGGGVRFGRARIMRDVMLCLIGAP